jgi:hypothetical protein
LCVACGVGCRHRVVGGGVVGIRWCAGCCVAHILIYSYSLGLLQSAHGLEAVLLDAPMPYAV